MRRIEYIDAMRGFTMFLVVLGHCAFYCMGGVADDNVYLDIFQSFRMPLFFFVSGFVFYKGNRIWQRKDLAEFFIKKIKVQILSPLLFLGIYLYLNDISLQSALFDPFKSGYWFTFALFEYFCLFILIDTVLQHLKCTDPVRTIVFLLISAVIMVVTNNRILVFLPNRSILDLISFPQMSFFLYFVIGSLVRKYFVEFERLLDTTNLLTICVITFFTLIVFEKYTNYVGVNYFTSILKAIAGILIVFAFFRKNATIFSGETTTGRVLQFIGRRTLDIYLIHYFILPNGLSTTFQSFDAGNVPLIELLLAIGLAIVVVCISLLISSLIRMSPQMASILFGYKRQV